MSSEVTQRAKDAANDFMRENEISAHWDTAEIYGTFAQWLLERFEREIAPPADAAMVDVEGLRSLSERATPGPWCWEQCGEKEDVPVIGVAWRVDDETFAQVEGLLRDVDHECKEVVYDRERIAFDIHGYEASASGNAAFIVAAVNFARAALAQSDRRHD